MAETIIKYNTPPAQYGNSPTGAMDARNEGMGRLANNDPAQRAIGGGMAYANGEAVNGRPGADMDQTAANNQASGADGNQAGAIELARRQAMGTSPSAAAYQLQAGLTQGLAQQTSMSRGARGGAALATAQSNAGYNQGAMQQNAYTQGGMLKSQDMATGRGIYGSLTNQKRGQDQAAVGMANEFSQANQHAADNYQLGMGNAAVGFGGVANAQNGADFSNAQNAMDPVWQQDDANQDAQGWLAAQRQATAAANKEGT